MITGNKGDWSEIYTLFRLLADGKIYAADEYLNKLDDDYYEIIKIFRKENIGNLVFAYDEDGNHIRIICEDDGKVLVLVPRDEFAVSASDLLNRIKTVRTKNIKEAFDHKPAEDFMDKIKCEKLKAPSTDKTDISMQIYDIRVGRNPKLGFSIKSRLGSPSTLLNASGATNFTYQIKGELDDEIIRIFDSERLFSDKFSALFSKGCKIEFVGVEHPVFSGNLSLIDADLHKILAYMLFAGYTSEVRGDKDLINLIEKIKTDNPLNYNLETHPFYEHKIKKLLAASALGMLPATPWSGKIDATGGYIIVREDGEPLCYHLYNQNEFEDYLLNNTKLDTPDKRNGFGVIYENDGEHFVKLNLQIRFTHKSRNKND